MQEFVSSFSFEGEVVFPEFSGTRVMMMPVVLGDMASVPETLSAWNDVVERLFGMQDYNGEIGYLTIDEKIVSAGRTHRRPGMHVDGVYNKLYGGWGGGGGGWGGGGTPERKQPPAKRHPEPLTLPSGGGWGGGGGGWGGGSSRHEPRQKPQPRRKPQPGERPDIGRGVSSGFGTGFLTVSSLEGCRAWDQEFIGFPGDEGECEHLADQCRADAELTLKANGVYWLDPLCVHESLAMKEHAPRQFLRLSLPSTAPWFEGYTENPLGVKPSGPILARRDFMDFN